MYVRHEGIRARAPINRTESPPGGESRFADLVGPVHDAPPGQSVVDGFWGALEKPSAQSACRWIVASFVAVGDVAGRGKGGPLSMTCRGQAAVGR